MRAYKLVLVALVALGVAGVAEAKKGLYLGFNLGGAVVSGNKNIAFPATSVGKDPDYSSGQADLNILFSTDVGGGFATNFRLGYNVMGIVAIELNVGGSGNNLGDSDKIEGQGGIGGLLRIFPAQIFPEVADRWWDPYIFFGAGVHFLGYNPQARGAQPMQNDGRAWWPGYTINYGLGCDFYLAPFFSLGIDLAFANASQDDFHIDNTNDITISPVDTATAFIFAPTAKLTFHFLTD